MGSREKIIETLLQKLPPSPGAFRVFHSTPNDWTPTARNPLGEPDLSKLRTGEGGTMYSSGLYASTSPEVSGRGGHYYNQFMQKFEGTPEGHAASELRNAGFDRAKALASSQANLDDIERFVKEGGQISPKLLDLRREQTRLLASDQVVGPRTYEIDVKRPISDFPKWFDTFGDLPVKQQRAFGTVARDYPSMPVGEGIKAAERDAEFARAMTNRRDVDRDQLSQIFAQRDIPGIRYPTSHARQGFTDPNTSQNVVIYDPTVANVRAKYGLAPVVGAGGAGMGALASPETYQTEEQ